MAVYTHVPKETLEAHLTQFDIGTLVSYEGVSEGVENSNYFLKTSAGKYVLTLFEKRVSVDELPFYIGFMEYLRENGIPSPAALRTREGDTTTTLQDRPSLISEFLLGKWPKDITPAHTRAVGATLAKMHEAGRKFTQKRANSMALPAWQALIQTCADSADTVEIGLSNQLQDELDFQAKNWPKFLPKGAIHADLFPDNVFFDGEKLCGIIDFYFSCTDVLAYDLMLTFNAWCFEKDGTLRSDCAEAFFDGYRKNRTLTPAELKALPFLGRAAALRIIATRLYDWLNPVDGAIVTPKDPLEHVRILRFHQNVQSLANYGLRV